MALYTLHAVASDGSVDNVMDFELSDDGEAYVVASGVLDQRPRASHVVAWCGERQALTRKRLHPDLVAVLTQANAGRW